MKAHTLLAGLVLAAFLSLAVAVERAMFYLEFGVEKHRTDTAPSPEND